MLSDALVDAIVERPGVLPSLICSSAGLGMIAWFSAGSLDWSRVYALFAAGGLALAVSVSLGRFGVNPIHPRLQISGCRMNSFSLDGDQQLLNFAMLAPFSFFATLATRRAWASFVASTLISSAIEVTQNLTGVGVCELQDVLNNAGGAALTAAVALAIDRVLSLHRKRMRYGRHACAPDRPAFKPGTTPIRSRQSMLARS